MAEIEHFVHPKKKDHPKFATVADLEVTLYPAPPRSNPLQERQMVRRTLGSAVREVRPAPGLAPSLHMGGTRRDRDPACSRASRESASAGWERVSRVRSRA